jgi:hypothetical protein
MWFATDDLNVAICTGPESGLIVLDEDTLKGGGQSIRAFTVPFTPKVATGGGGFHYYIRDVEGADVRNSAGVLGQGLDIRGAGGYVIAPPSLHVSGQRYKWIIDPREVGLAECPDFILDLQRPKMHSDAEVHVAGDGDAIPEGQRDTALTSLAGSMRRRGMTEEEILAALQVTNAKRCKPPLPDVEVRRIAESVSRYAPAVEVNNPGNAMAHAYEDANDVEIHATPWPNPMDDAAFHGLAGDIVRTIEPHTEADITALLVQVLVAYGNAIGRGAYFEADGAGHHGNLNAVLVGETSKGRKGTSWAQILRLLRTATPDWAENRVTEGLSSGEGLIWAVRDAIVKHDPIKEKGHVTEYQDVEVDPGVQDKRLLVVEGEFAQVLKVCQREGNTLSPVLRRAWDGNGKLQSMTKNSPAVSTNPHVSIIGHIVKDELVRLLETTEAANGFANRFLWVCVRRSKCLPEGGRLHEVDFRKTVDALAAAIEYGQTLDRLIIRDADAKDLWHQVYPALSEGRPGLIGSVTSRAEAQVMRMAMIYALLDLSPAIKAVHLEAAIAVWMYCDASAQYIFGQSLGDPIADEILYALKRTPEGMSRTDIRDLFGRNRGKGQVARALGLLLGQNLAYCTSETTPGRPKELWFAGSRPTPKTTETT